MEEQQQKQTLTLLDFYWFHSDILGRPPSPPSPPPLQQLPVPYPWKPEPRRHRHSRSKSEEGSHTTAPRIHSPPKLETILSGQVDVMREVIPRADVATRTMKKKKGVSKSMSDLEFEELKGFMDLGFTFCGEVEADPRLLSIVPGLKRAAGGKELIDEESVPGVRRPYLSEAWEEEENMLRNWKVPDAGAGVDMKGHLKEWAHAVASAAEMSISLNNPL